LLFTKKKLHQCSRQITGTFKKRPPRVYISRIVTSSDPLSPTPTSSAMKTPENKQKDPDDPEPADGDTQMEYSCD
jgi:hypothetical protein